MRPCLWTVILAGCLLMSCADYNSELCIPHVDTSCVQGNNYWVDSCGRLENVLEKCECGCRADRSGCRICGEKECETNADCPENHYCDRTDWYCKPIECTPDCTGKCCGEDGCGGTCPDNCSGGERCNRDTCRCELEMECETNADCPQGYWCNRTVWRCQRIECMPDCTGKCCGPDGCGGTCSNNCRSGYWCNPYSCTCERFSCQTDADCRTTQCCMHNVCVDMNCGNLQCGPDPVCGFECGPCPEGESCNNGVCEHVDESPCPAGQECTDITGTGYLGCIIPPATLPPGNQTGCDPGNGILCDGNYTCFILDESSTACVENCGTCPDGTECYKLWWDGPLGCLSPGCFDLPPNPSYCDADYFCGGNATCYAVSTGEYICIHNCSQDHGP